ASRDLFVVPDARGHEYIRVGKNGVRAKLGIDATIPVDEKGRFARCEFVDVGTDCMSLSSDTALLRTYLGSDSRLTKLPLLAHEVIALCCAGAPPSPHYKLGFDRFDAW